MKNPFTHTPGKVGDANISTDIEEIVYENFRHPVPSEGVFKIIGVRGSGKTVIFGNIIRHYKSKEMKDEGWLSYDLSSARSPINTLISYLMLEPEVKKALISEKANLNVTIPLVGVSAGISGGTDYDSEVRLEQLLGILVNSDKKIMIGIDDISKTAGMTEFCSVYAKLIRNVKDDETPWPIYLICSGVYQNFYELGEVDNLTFFKRSYELRTQAFSYPAITIKYEDLLGMDEDTAIEYARETKGFAYAYQVIGSSYFEYGDKGKEEVLRHAKSELFSQCYEKIWKELPSGAKEIMSAVADGPKKRKEVIEIVSNKGSYQVYSTSLKNMGLLVSSDESYGVAEITLPFFGEYIQKYS